MMTNNKFVIIITSNFLGGMVKFPLPLDSFNIFLGPIKSFTLKRKYEDLKQNYYIY